MLAASDALYAQDALNDIKNGKFELVPAVEDAGLVLVTVGRGSVFGDIFNEGKIDVVINSLDGVPILLRNVNPDHHHWVELKLIGSDKSPRDAIGATVYLTVNGLGQREDVLNGGSNLSSNDFRIHFGLESAADAGPAEIYWHYGKQGMTEALCGRKPCADRFDDWSLRASNKQQWQSTRSV